MRRIESLKTKMLEFLRLPFAIVTFASLAINLSEAAPRAAGLSSSNYGRILEARFRLGRNKDGIADWTVANHNEAGLLRNSPETPVEFIDAKPQLAGGMGNSEPPRYMLPSQQFHPQQYDAPQAGLVSPPGALRSLTDGEREAISTEFLVKYKYLESEEAPTKRALVGEMQRSYGIRVTGDLDDETVLNMLSPRCGTPDAPAAYRTFGGKPTWKNTTVTWKITGYSPDMSQCQIRNTFKRSFRVWEEVTDLTFHMVDERNADIIIYFGYKEHGDGYPFDNQNGLLAHAFSPGWSSISGDTHFDESEMWTLGNGKVFDTYYGNSGGKPCVFPFKFKEKNYHSCTSAGRKDGLEWCATSPDFDRDENWAFCPHERLFTYGGNSSNNPCVFPFTFLGQTYDSCTYEGKSDGYRWCSTTSDFDKDKKWGFCPSRAHGTEDGNSDGAACVFPFTFEGYTYSDCTTRGRSDYRLWCSTTSDFEKDKKWGFCSGKGYSLFLVAAHEFGHAIGLDHSSVRGSLMYPSYSFFADFTLPEDDMNGARDLYGGPRTRPLPPLQLEKCGGDLTETEITKPAATTMSTATMSTATMSTATTTRETTTLSTIKPTTTPATTGKVGECDFTEPKTICDRPIDAAMMFQQELFIFQGPFLWRVYGKGKRQTRYMSRVEQYWPELRCGVDAVYQRPNDGKLIFFKGTEYYVYQANRIDPDYPRNVTELGLPSQSVVDDVVYMLSRNQETRQDEDRTYYFVGDRVFRANNENGKVLMEFRPTYLGGSKEWLDLPADIDAAYREDLTKPFTVFLKNNEVYRYANKREKVKPLKSGNPVTVEKFFGC